MGKMMCPHFPQPTISPLSFRSAGFVGRVPSEVWMWRRRDCGVCWSGPGDQRGHAMNNRNGLYLVIGLLVIAAVAAGYLLYKEEQKSGVDIEIGESGISIEER
jgi:hypothetical protein